MVLEQFKNLIPKGVATYVNEQKPSSVLKAAELADNFVLGHKSGCDAFLSMKNKNGPRSRYNAQSLSSSPAHILRGAHAKEDSNRVCNYCKGTGHWKDRFLILKSKNKSFSPAGWGGECCVLRFHLVLWLLQSHLHLWMLGSFIKLEVRFLFVL